MNGITIVTTLIGYFVVVAFFGTDSGQRQGEAAKSLQAGEFDQRSTRFIGLAYFVSVLALLASWLLSVLKGGVLPDWIGWLGVLLSIGGLFVRRWAHHTLGTFYTRTLKVLKEQYIVREGPYRYIRHPGYLGSILIWAGVSLATANWIVFAIVLAVMLAAYHYRMDVEEQMLLETQEGYADYRSQTKRLIPFVY